MEDPARSPEAEGDRELVRWTLAVLEGDVERLVISSAA
jgi:hypothetical protein